MNQYSIRTLWREGSWLKRVQIVIGYLIILVASPLLIGIGIILIVIHMMKNIIKMLFHYE